MLRTKKNRFPASVLNLLTTRPIPPPSFSHPAGTMPPSPSAEAKLCRFTYCKRSVEPCTLHVYLDACPLEDMLVRSSMLITKTSLAVPSILRVALTPDLIQSAICTTSPYALGEKRASVRKTPSEDQFNRKARPNTIYQQKSSLK